MAINPSIRKLTEVELNAPDLDDDGKLDVEHYPVPLGDQIKDPYLRKVWDQAAKELNDKSGKVDHP